MAKRIHLIDDGSGITKLDEHTWEYAFCELEGPIARRLVGGSILFHKKPSEPSFYGGIILSYRVREGREGTKVAFKFQYAQSHRGIPAARGRWYNGLKVASPL